MVEQIIICPYCKKEIPLNEVISIQIREKIEKELEAKIKEKERELSKKEKEIEETRKTIDEQMRQKLRLEIEKLEKKAKQEALETVNIQLKDLENQIQEKNKKLEEAQKMELEFRKRARELEERQKTLELEIARKLDQETKKIKEESYKKFLEEHRFKDLEKDKIINDLKKQLEEATRKAQEGSQQLKGEVLELELEDILKQKFPFDSIEQIRKGVKGADILQKVYTKSGHFCGIIIWESKRTKDWSKDWLGKLKDDQRQAKAEIAVLVSEALPEGLNSFGNIEGVWVSNFSLFPNLAEVLRNGLIQLAQVKLAAIGKNEKMEILYNYLSGPEFRQKVEAIVESFVAMKNDLEAEKRAMEKIWAKREKHLQRTISNTAEMYGDMQGIIGASLPEIKALELKAVSE